MVGSRYPFRDPPRRPDDQSSGNRIDRPRDQTQGNRRPERGRPRDESAEAAPLPALAPEAAGATLAALNGELESLVRLITATDVTELSIESGTFRVLIRRGAATPAPPQAPVVMMPAPAAVPAAEAPAAPPAPAPPLPAVPGHAHPTAPEVGPGEQLVVSPMVGTFYAAPSPMERPFVVEGDEVTVGQTIGIVEAMKMMNQIEAEVAGRVTRILVRDAQGVEYGQPLMVIAEG